MQNFLSSLLCCFKGKEIFFHKNKQNREDLADINMSCNVRGVARYQENFLHVANLLKIEGIAEVAEVAELDLK